MILTAVILYSTYILMFAFSTVCLACGLLYLAEVIEEYTVLTKKIIRYTVFGVIGLHVLLFFFEDFPVIYLLVGIGAHAIYASLLKDFPYIQFTDPKLILSVVSLIGNHGLWFYYFTENYLEFNELVSFFLICVWLVPFLYFLSLSAGENAIPFSIVSSCEFIDSIITNFKAGEVTSEDFSHPIGRKRGKRGSSFMAFINFLQRKKDQYLPTSRSQKLF